MNNKALIYENINGKYKQFASRFSAAHLDFSQIPSVLHAFSHHNFCLSPMRYHHHCRHRQFKQTSPTVVLPHMATASATAFAKE